MNTLRRFIQQQSLTQAQFAKKIGVSQPTVAAWLHGYWKPSMLRLHKIAKVTGVPLAQVIREFYPSVR